ncbi:fasciclin-2-like isoform X3 [Amphibalanus amphitrite]|uniref:fasciclin-2-like isoform X3 n=1 Tax=Amphibalanus amphitrite TaxID=1232801 RepID=UPI001C91B80B|nr:fasciclin-2-like isoform X3 [Amphibalanus amphitrite]
MRSRGVLCFIAAIATAALAQEEQVKLEILPSQAKIRRDLGKQGFFTCRAAAGFEDLIDDIIWLNPENIEVPAESRESTDQPTPRIYTGQFVPSNGRELFISPIQEQDSGIYTCKARYATNQEVTKAFELVVYMSIRFEDAPEQQNPQQGTTAKIKCVVRANPVAVVEWIKDDKTISSGGRFVVEQDGLVIQDISSEDDGTYICRAKVPDEGELAERRIQVEVHSLPQILEPAEGATFEVTEKEQGSIPCRTAGKPLPTLTWVNPENAEADNVDGLSVDPKDGTLNFDPARRDMGGEYRCMAENALGKVETTVNVVIIVKPEIIRYENITVNEGETARLECKVAGSPLPEVKFRKLGRDDRFEEGTAPDDDRIQLSQRVEDGYRIGTLTITDLKRADDGLYECIAINKGGELLKNGHITTQFKPDFDKSPMHEIFSWHNNPVNLTCVAESIPNATITWEFKRRRLGPDGDLDKNIQQIGNGPTSVLQVIPVDTTYFGTFTCKASNLLGDNMLDIELFEATVPSPLTDVRFHEVTATTVTFDMNGPANDGGLPLISYAVQYKQQGDSWDAKEELQWPVGTTYVVSGLRPERAYVFRFATKNDVGLSEWSAEQPMVMPKIDVPEAPRILLPDSTLTPAEGDGLSPREVPVVNSSSPHSFSVQWQAGANNGEKINNFEVTYYEVMSTKTGQWRSVSSEHKAYVDFPGNNAYTMEKLSAGTHYRVELRAHNKIGLGAPASIIVRTAPGQDSDPELSKPENIVEAGGGSEDDPPALASAAVVGVVVGVLLVLLLLVDLTCWAVSSRGMLHSLCGKAKGAQRSQTLEHADAASEKQPLQDQSAGNGTNATSETTSEPPPDVAVTGSEAADPKDSAV